MEGNKSLGDIQNTLKNNKDDLNQNLITNKSKKSKKKSRKRKYSSSSDESSVKRYKSKHKKKCKKRHKHDKDKRSKSNKDKLPEKCQTKEEETVIGPEVPNDLLKKAQSMAPMSKEEWEKRQNTIRRVYDDETGRTRLIRGEGEIIEEIVSRDRHKEINRQATQGDGEFFQSKIKKWV